MKRERLNTKAYRELRKDLEDTVTSFKSNLKGVVQTMTDYVLLNNCHPIYRKDFAHRMYEFGKINDWQLSEYTHKSY